LVPCVRGLSRPCPLLEGRLGGTAGRPLGRLVCFRAIYRRGECGLAHESAGRRALVCSPASTRRS